MLVFLINILKKNLFFCVHTQVTLNCILRIVPVSFGIAPGSCQIPVPGAILKFKFPLVPTGLFQGLNNMSAQIFWPNVLYIVNMRYIPIVLNSVVQ